MLHKCSLMKPENCEALDLRMLSNLPRDTHVREEVIKIPTLVVQNQSLQWLALSLKHSNLNA